MCEKTESLNLLMSSLVIVVIPVLAYFGKYCHGNWKQRKKLKNIIHGELYAIKLSCQEAIETGNFQLLQHSIPLWQSIAETMGYLNTEEIKAARNAVRLYMLAAQKCTPISAAINQKILCEKCIAACTEAFCILKHSC